MLTLLSRFRTIPFTSQFSQPTTSIFRSFSTKMNHPNDSNLDQIFAKKRALRIQIRQLLKNMTPSQRAEEDSAIQNSILEAPWYKSANSLCAYVNCDALREVDTSIILSAIICDNQKDNFGKNRKKLYLPRIEDRNSNMRMLRVSSNADLIPNSMNILEPTLLNVDGNHREDLMLSGEPIDLFILPGLAFDKSGRRLGRNGGYYDMYLKKYFKLVEERKWRNPLLVALSYSTQIVEEGTIAVTSDDIPVDVVVCPSGVIFTNTSGKDV